MTDRRFWRRSIGSEQRIANLVEHLARRGNAVTVAYVGRLLKSDRDELDAFVAPFPKLEVLGRSLDLAGAALALRLRARRLLNSILDWFQSPGRAAEHPGAACEDRSFRMESSNPLLAEPSSLRRAFVERLLIQRRPDLVIVEMVRLTATVYPRPSCKGWQAIYLIDTIDVVHQRAERFRAGGAQVQFNVDAHEEGEALATYDVLLAIQEGDRRVFRALVPGKTVLTVPHGLSIPTQAPDESPRIAADSRPIRLGLLGGRDESNLAGLSWFLDAVWPTLAERFGDRIELRVAGQICERFSRTEKGMEIVGPVASIGDFWSEIDIAINPIRFGSGLKIKNVEALAYARPLLTSTVGAEGLEGAAPAGLAIADSAAQWLERLSTWIVEPAIHAEIARHGRRFAEAHFSPDTAFAQLDAYVDAIPNIRALEDRPTRSTAP